MIPLLPVFIMTWISGSLLFFYGISMITLFFIFITLTAFIPHIRQKSGIALAIALLIVGAGGFLYTDWEITGKGSYLTGEETALEARSIEPMNLTSSGRRWSSTFLTEDNEKIAAFIDAEDGQTKAPVRQGQTCRFEAELSKPDPPSNPYAFDYQAYLWQEEIFWMAEIKPSSLSCSDGNIKMLDRLKQSRENGIEKMTAAKSADSSESAPLLAALVFGERQLMDRARLDQYQALGVIHLLAVSGLHVAFLSGALYYLLLRFNLTREQSETALLCAMPLYIVIAGGAPSVTRAVLMMMIFIAAKKFGFRLNGIDAVSLVAGILLIQNPELLLHMGFQLSFITTAALLISKGWLINGNKLQQLLKVTVIAQIVSAPVLISQMYELSVIAVAANAAMVPLVTLGLLPLAFVIAACNALFGQAPNVLWSAADRLVNGMNHLLDLFAAVPWHSVVLGAPEDWQLFLWLAAACLSLLCLEKKKYASAALLLTSVFFIHYFSPLFETDARITMLDVGQGDAIVIELPRREEVILIDTGGAPHFGEDSPTDIQGPGIRAIEPFFRGRGIRRIDTLLLTHGHQDHVGDVCDVNDIVTIDRAIYPAVLPVSDTGKAALSCLQDDDVAIKPGIEGKAWRSAQSYFHLLHPQGHEAEENERSIVLAATIEDVRFLFTGDIEEESENRLVQDDADLKADVLKVGHHGSLTSSTEPFLEAVEPATALIPVGENNRYGHPSTEVLERLADAGAETYRTDVDGAVTVTVKDGGFEVKTQNEPN